MDGRVITIWDYFVNSPKERAALMRVANAWAKKTGNKVSNPGDVAESLQKYPLAARGGRGPDVIQFPHDNLGRFAAAGVIASASRASRTRSCTRRWPTRRSRTRARSGACRSRARRRSCSTTRPCIAQPPKTSAQLIAAAKPLTSGDQYGFLWSPADFFYDYAFIGGYGGFVFQQTKAGYNGKRLGLATPGAIAASS